MDVDDSSRAERTAAGGDENSSSATRGRDRAKPEDESESDDDASDDNDDGDGGYDSDTQIIRIADSAASFARRCIACGVFSKALVALRNVVEVAEPPSRAYTQCVLLIAQLFQLTSHFDASLAAMMDVLTCMPAPYTPNDGLLIIVRLYELKGAPDFAAFWWNRLLKQQRSASSNYQQRLDSRAKLLEGFANRSFAQRDFVFALDAFTEIFHKHRDYYASRRSYARMHKHLHSEDQAAQLVYKDRYADADFYNLRNVYVVSFPAIYRAVFAWDDAPARAIGVWWRACRKRHRQRQEQQQHIVETQRGEDEKLQLSSQPESRRAKTKKQQSATDAKPPRKEPETSPPKPHRTIPFKVSHKRSPSKRALGSTTISEKRSSACESGGGAEVKKQTNQGEERGLGGASSTELRSSAPGFHVAQPFGRQIPTAKCRGSGFSRHQQQSDDFYENSPTKRKLNAVRHLRKQNLADELSDLPLSKPPPLRDERNKDIGQDDEDDCTRSRTSLLDVYALPSPTAAESFLASAGRAPRFADLDLDELEKYARVAHYRARVLIHKHVDVKQLDEERVKPQWLLSFDKTEAMVMDLQQQQQSLADDTTAAKLYLTQIHSRVVFQLTAILKQYKRDFGDTSFTRQLHALIQRLRTWKYAQIPTLLTAMESAKKAGVREEKQRNLEFFHVHQGREQQHTGECIKGS